MSDNKRNIDSPDIGTGQGGAEQGRDDAVSDKSGRQNPFRGNQSPAGTGSHAAHQREADAGTADNKAKGTEARVSGYGKGLTRPESGRN
ncbi:hypothetical protein [Azospirillum thermophilum]|uniref:Uncharacterized protein n=1 Tax=Azospirillum thermophilum TaxID=2202148 RepID=A0A2S2CPJ2_9PROT|nr:hypothetical protein [Azospirillum thermophilum]AWK86396.1 hypothetical protein DEW08_09220 [Azospirillum thermophilum]